MGGWGAHFVFTGLDNAPSLPLSRGTLRKSIVIKIISHIPPGERLIMNLPSSDVGMVCGRNGYRGIKEYMGFSIISDL